MRTTKLTTVIASAVFILVVGLILNLGQLYWMAGLLLSLPCVGWFYALAQARGIAVSRRLPPSGRVGEWIRVELRAQNRTTLPKMQLWLVENLPTALTDSPPPQVPLHLPPLGSDRGDYSVRLETRGLHQLDAVRLVSVDPLGLSAVSLDLPCPGEILVYPRVVPLRPDCLPVGSDGAVAQSDESHRRGESATFESIREYQPGDPLRRVHWRSSARWGRLAVVEYEDERSCDLVLAIENRRGSHAGEGAENSFEYGITLAASLASLAIQRGHSVQLLTSDSFDLLPCSDRGQEGFFRIMDRLARLEAEAHGSLQEILPGVLGSLRGRPALIWITPLTDAELVTTVAGLAAERFEVTVLGLDRASFSGRQESSSTWASIGPELLRSQASFALFRHGDPLARVLEILGRGGPR